MAAADTETWPDALDALVAAPQFHRLVLENDDVRVLETTIGPGEIVPLHTHRWPSILHTLATGHFVRRDGEGNVLSDTRAGDAMPAVGSTVWIGPMGPHTFENADTCEIRVLNVELKR